MSKPRFPSWSYDLKQHINRIARKFSKYDLRRTHINRLMSVLQDTVAQIDEQNNNTHTLILEKYPDIPVRYFSNLIRTPYRVGLKRYKDWHHNKGIKPPLTGRTSAEARQKWREIIMDEIMPK